MYAIAKQNEKNRSELFQGTVGKIQTTKDTCKNGDCGTHLLGKSNHIAPTSQYARR